MPITRAGALLDGSEPIFLNPGHTGGGLHFLHELRNAGYNGPIKTGETVSLTYVTRMEGPATVGIYSYIKQPVSPRCRANTPTSCSTW